MIHAFSGDYDFLSNFYLIPVRFEDAVYRSAEHAYQAAKFDDWNTREMFLDYTLSAAGAKDLGNRIPCKDPYWTDRRIFVMRDVLQAKFVPDSALAKRLLSTEDHVLIEGNTWGDTFWGQVRGHGDNWLGRLLMLTREDLRRQRETLF